MEKKLRELLINYLDYDASVIYECEKCGHERKRFWIDHRTVLAHNIAELLGIKMIEAIHEILQEASLMTRGDKKEDTDYIATKINEDIIELKK
jgi:hypothetical protein